MRTSFLLVALAAAAGGLLCAPLSHGQTVALPPGADPSQPGFAQALLSAAQHHLWSYAVALALIAGVWAVGRFGAALSIARGWARVSAALESDAGKLTLVFLLTGLGAVATALAAGQPLSGPIVTSAFAVAFKAIGGYQAIKKLLWPLVRKIAGMPATVTGAGALVAACLIGLPARADTAEATAFSHGPSIPLIAVGYTKDSAGHVIPEAGLLNAGAGYSFNWNLLPTADGSVRQLTLSVPVFTHVGTPASGAPLAFGLSAGFMVGTYNNLFAIGVAYDLFNVTGGSDSSGLFVKPGLINLRWLIAINFNIGGGQPPAAPANARLLVASPEPLTPPPGYVKLL